MKPATKTFIILVCILAGTLAFYLFYAVPRWERQLQFSQTGYRNISISPDRVQKIEIKNKYGRFSFRGENGSWKMIRPLETGSNDFELNTIVDYFKLLKIRPLISGIEKGVALSQYGLENPAIELSLWEESGERLFTLHLGDITPDETSVYGIFEGEAEIVILPMYLTILLDTGLFDLRDKSVFSFDVGDVARVEIEFADSAIEIERTAEQNWRFTMPMYGAAADSHMVEQLLNQLKWITIKEFYDEEPPAPQSVGLDHPWAEIEVADAASAVVQKVSFGFIHEQKGIYAKSNTRDDIFLLPIEATRFFNQDIHHLRDKSVFRFDTNDIEKVTLDYPGVMDDITIIRDPLNEWVIGEKEKTKTDVDAVENYFKELRALESKKFLSLSEFKESELSFLNEGFRLILEKINGERIILSTGSLFEDNPELIYAYLDHQNEAMLLDVKALNDLQKNKKYFVYRYLYQFDIEDVNRVDFIFHDVETSVHHIKEDKWQVTVPHKKTIQRFPILLLLRELWRLKSTHEGNQTDIEQLVQEKPSIVIELWLESLYDPVQYRIWDLDSNENYFIVELHDRHHAADINFLNMLKRHLSNVYSQTK